MRRKYKIWSNIFIAVCIWTILIYYFVKIPTLNEFLKKDALFLEQASIGSKIQRYAYYIGYMTPILVLVFWGIKSYNKPVNYLKRRGFKSEAKNLVSLFSSGTITKSEFESKLDLLERQMDQSIKEEILQKKHTVKAKAIEADLKSLEELFLKNVISKAEYERKKVLLHISLNNDQIDLDSLEKLVSKFDFGNYDTDMLLTKKFQPTMSERDSDNLLSVIKSDDFTIEAIYQAYVELKGRIT